jgi:hypothetical protein
MFVVSSHKVPKDECVTEIMSLDDHSLIFLQTSS